MSKALCDSLRGQRFLQGQHGAMSGQQVPGSVSEPAEVEASDALSRRAALARLGLAGAVAYVAPTLMRIDRSANAKVLPTPCPPPGQGGGNPAHCPPGGGPPGGGPSDQD